MNTEKSCSNCQRRANGTCYELKPRLCGKYLAPLSRQDREAWRNAKDEADQRKKRWNKEK